MGTTIGGLPAYGYAYHVAHLGEVVECGTSIIPPDSGGYAYKISLRGHVLAFPKNSTCYSHQV